MALLTWGILVASDGTLMREKTLNNVPVSVSGESSLRTRGYIVTLHLLVREPLEFS